MRVMNVAVLFCVLLVGLVGLGAFGEAEPQYGGELVYAYPGEARSLFPGTVWGWLEMEIWANCLETLVQRNAEGELVPYLAKSWDFSEDGLQCTFNLREGIQYADGSPFNAEAVEFVYSEALRVPFGSVSMLSGVNKIEATDEYTVVFHFDKPLASFIANMSCSSLSLWSPALYQEHGKDYMDTHLLGTGPFMLDEWVHGEYIRLVKNENYWQDGLPYLDAIKYVIVPDESVRIMMLEAGEADRTINVNDFELERLDAAADITVRTIPSARQYYIIINNVVHPLDNANVRRALNYAVSKKGIVQTVFAGVGAAVPRAPILSENVAFFTDMTKPGEDCLYEQDLDMAARYFALAGFEDRDGNGILEDPYGEELTLKLWGEEGHYKGDVKLFEALGQMLSNAGVKVETQILEHATYSAKFRLEPERAEYDLGVLAWGIPTLDPDEVALNLFYSYLDLPRPGINRMFYGNPEVDALAMEQHYAIDPVERQALLDQWAAQVVEDAPVIFMPTLSLNLVTRTYLHNDEIRSNEAFPHAFAWLDQEEMARQGVSR